MVESKFWCFTLNNPSEDDEQSVTDFLSDQTHVRYGVVGRESGESRHTPHLQGFIILTRSRRRSFLTSKFQAHFTVRYAHSTNEEAAAYCKKEGDFEEFGSFPKSEQGKRKDLEEYIEWGDSFTQENGRPPSLADIAKHQPIAYIRYPRLSELFALRAPPVVLQQGEPKQWQRELRERLEDPAHDRQIDFYIDEVGGLGKSWFIRWMYSLRPNDVQILSVGKKEDIAYVLDETKSVFLFNIARGQMEFISYPLLENLKDRMVLSGKFGSKVKLWYNNVHVVVLGNEYPDEDKLTTDRYNITHLN